MPRLFETKEAAKLLRLRARRAETIGRMTAVAVADRDRAKQHQLGRHVDERADDAVHARPGFLRAGVEPVAAGQKHQRMNIAAEIRPLAGTEPAIDGDEERHRRVEEFVVAPVLVKPRDGIAAVDIECAVKLHAMMLTARTVRLPHRLRINRIFSVLLARIAAGDRGGDFLLELGQRRARQRVDLPRLQIAARSRARGARDQIAEQVGGDRLVEKPAAGNAGIDGFEQSMGELSWGGLIDGKFLYYRGEDSANALANAGGNDMATDAGVTVAARLDRLPPSRHTRRLITLLSLGGWFEFYDLFFTAYVAIGLFKAGIFTPTTQGLFDLKGFASFVAALFLGLFIGTLAFSWLSDRFGRRSIFTFALLWYSIGALVMAFQHTPETINLWRLIASIALGVELVNVDTYLSELVPKEQRGPAFAYNQFVMFT